MPKLSELRQSLEDASHREDELREINTIASDQLTQLKKEMQALNDVRIVQEKRIAELVEELDRERNITHLDVIAAKDKEIERLRRECQRLERDFDDLMDIKIQLALTIEKYRDLLSEEEHRLGLETPGRKRKRSKRSSEGPVLQLGLSDQFSNCLLVKNPNSNPFSLQGWALQSGSFVFEFPNNFKIPASDEAFVWINESLKGEAETKETAVHITWEGVAPEELVCLLQIVKNSTKLFLQTAEPMQLVDNKGNVVDQLEVEAVTGDRPNDQSGCLIM